MKYVIFFSLLLGLTNCFGSHPENWVKSEKYYIFRYKSNTHDCESYELRLRDDCCGPHTKSILAINQRVTDKLPEFQRQISNAQHIPKEAQYAHQCLALDPKALFAELASMFEKKSKKMMLTSDR